MQPEDVSSTWPVPSLAGRTLEFSSDFLSVSLEPLSDGDEARVEVHSRLARKIDVDIHESGNSVVMRISTLERGLPGWGFWEWGPHAHVTIFVPSDVRARMNTDAGRFRIRGLRGCDLELNADAGTIDLDDVHGRLTLNTSAGKIEGERVGGTLEVTTSAGAVKLAIDALDAGQHRVHTDVGSVKLELARDLDVRVDATTTMGGVKVSYPTREDGRAILRVSTEVGSVRVKGPSDHAQHARREWKRTSRSASFSTSVAVPVDAEPVDSEAEVMRVLQMVETGKITAKDAQDLLKAMGRF